HRGTSQSPISKTPLAGCRSYSEQEKKGKSRGPRPDPSLSIQSLPNERHDEDEMRDDSRANLQHNAGHSGLNKWYSFYTRNLHIPQGMQASRTLLNPSQRQVPSVAAAVRYRLVTIITSLSDYEFSFLKMSSREQSLED
ncbi:16418_t:CDS:2, partial [Acaulospora colombiana]